MIPAICPYCRTPIAPEEGNELVCTGCGTPHHADCYAENGGCTIFGCSAAPAEEPKLRVTGSDLTPLPPAAAPPVSPTLGLPTTVPVVAPPTPPPPPVRVKAPPPPLPPGVTATAPAASSAQFSTPGIGAGSTLFSFQPTPAPAYAAPAPATLSFEPDPNAKNRMTFIILGVLLGPFGAHNFYAGYKGKAFAQLAITALTLGFGGPMAWVWAVIDVWTVDKDSQGIKFRS